LNKLSNFLLYLWKRFHGQLVSSACVLKVPWDNCAFKLIYEYYPKFNPIVHKYLLESSQRYMNVPEFHLFSSTKTRAMNIARFPPLLYITAKNWRLI